MNKVHYEIPENCQHYSHTELPIDGRNSLFSSDQRTQTIKQKKEDVIENFYLLEI